MHRVFVYGTLKHGQPNHHLLATTPQHDGHVTFTGQGHTEVKYPLVQAGPFNIPYLLELPGKGELVEGEIYTVNAAMLQRMDQLEGHPNYYERVKVKVRILHGVDEGHVQTSVQCHTESQGRIGIQEQGNTEDPGQGQTRNQGQGQTLMQGQGQREDTVECWTYFLRNYRPELEELPVMRVFDAYSGDRRFRMPREQHDKQKEEVMLKQTGSQ